MLPDNKIKMRLSKIGDCRIYNNLSSYMGDKISSSNLRINYNMTVQINRSLSTVMINTAIKYYDGETALFFGDLDCFFMVEDLFSYVEVTKGDNSFQVKSDFLPMLEGIAFSTTRGYFARELVGSILEDFPFPMITIDNLLKRTSYQII